VLRRDPIERFRKRMQQHGWITKDWFTRHAPQWDPLLQPLEGQKATILELGSFEGLSTAYLLWRLPDALITAVDTFAGEPSGPETEQRFDHNIALVDKNRVEKIVAPTYEALPRLLADGRRFHFIYVDASHHVLDVIVDAALSWRMLRPGGVIVFDDYGIGGDPQRRPTEAVDAFMRLVADLAEPVPCGWQAAFRRVR
jgi:predicted O-methyltransferase YrrM